MPLSNAELVSIIDAHRRNSLGDETTDLSTERATAMDHYHGRPYGNEQDGRSQVVSKDLADTVGWLMPAIMKVLVSSGNIVEFSPSTEEDETTAQQESDYVNHVIMKDNSGFLLLHDVIKDTLLLKNGYVKHWWDESESTTEREYSGLSGIQLTQLFNELEGEDAEVDVLEQDSEMVVVETELGPIEQEEFTVKLRIKRTSGRVRLEAIPTEEIRVSKRARAGTQNSEFIEWFNTKTRTELIEMGMDAEFVDNLPAKTSSPDNDQQEQSRSSISDETDESGTSFDRSMDEIDYSEAYILVDYDEDGVAELRKVITVADTNIPPGDEWNEVIDTVPLTGFVSKRVPHRHIAESLDDDLADLQEIKTVLYRQLLDNVYNTNNQQTVVNNLANIPDFLQSLPGGVKRIDTDQPINGMVMPLVSQPIIDQILPAIDQVDKVKDERTGVNEFTTNINPDVLKQANNVTFMESADKASQKVEMIIRMLIETGVKELALRTHEIILKHQDKARIVKIRGEFVNVNPTEWRERTDLTINVGLGTGTEEQRRQKLITANQLQTGMAEMGLVGPGQKFNLFNDTLESLGIEMAGRYAIDPNSEEYAQLVQQQQLAAQQPQPNPLAEAEMVKAQAKVQTDQMDAQVKMALQVQAENHQFQMEEMKLKMQAANDEADRLSKETIEAAKLEIEAMLEGFKIDLGKPGVGAGLQEQAKVFDPTTGTFI